MSGQRLAYRFGPLERRGLLGGVGYGQVLTLATGAGAAIVAIDQSPSAAGALEGTVALAFAIATTALRIGGRTFGEWAPVAGAYLLRLARTRVRFRSPVPSLGMSWTRAAGKGKTSLRGPRPQAPAALRNVSIVETRYRDRTVGALSERGGRRLTTVLACRVLAFALLDPEAQERRLAHWGLVLSGAASSAVRRIQWIERTAPAQGDELARWLHNAKDPAIPLRGAPIIESYLELIATSAQVTQGHEILIAIQVDGARVRERGRDAVSRALIEAAERVAQNLEAAEISVLGALSAGQLARVLRTAFDPYARSELAALETVDGGRDGLAAVNAWPLGAHEAWEHYRSDGAYHATYWIGGWPRVEVSPMFMDAMLGRSSVARTVAVTFEPIAPERSTREVEAAVTRDRADRELRARFGQAETARQRQSQEAAERREAELAAGHSEVRLAGFVTVSGRDQVELRRACAEVLEHAARARLELHRMYGQQADAFTFTLPLGRGLR
ncbi:MAG: SCO6880 family protein [Solirubrobacteraceae bacterium]